MLFGKFAKMILLLTRNQRETNRHYQNINTYDYFNEYYHVGFLVLINFLFCSGLLNTDIIVVLFHTLFRRLFIVFQYVVNVNHNTVLMFIIISITIDSSVSYFNIVLL